MYRTQGLETRFELGLRASTSEGASEHSTKGGFDRHNKTGFCPAPLKRVVAVSTALKATWTPDWCAGERA